MKQSGFQNLLCMKHLSVITSKDVYLKEFVSLARNMGADNKRIIQFAKIQSSKLRKFTFNDASIRNCDTDETITCKYICSKYHLNDVCKACKDSSTYSNQYDTLERDILSYCLADASYLVSIENYINSFTLSGDAYEILFSSYYNLDPSCDSILYKPLNYYIYVYLHSLPKYPDNLDTFKANFLGYLPTCFQIQNNWFIDIVDKHITTLITTALCNKGEPCYTSGEQFENLTLSIFERLKPYIVNRADTPQRSLSNSSNDEFQNYEPNSLLSEETNETNQDHPLLSEPNVSEPSEKPLKQPYSTTLSTCDCVNSLVGNDGYLINTLQPEDFKCVTMVNTPDYVRQFDYDVLKADVIVLEYVVYNRNSGLLFYIPTSKKYYFIDIKNTSVVVPDIIPVLNYYFCEDDSKIKLSMFTEAIYKYLDFHKIKANSNIFSIVAYHHIANPDMPASSLYEILAKGSHIYLTDELPLLLQVMPYYSSVYYKYIGRLTINQLANMHQLSELSHVLSRSLYIEQYYPFKEKYLLRNLFSYKFSYDQLTPLYAKKDTKAVLLTITANDNNTHEYTVELLFQLLCVKLFEGRFFYKYDIVILNMDAADLSIYVPGTAYRMVYTAINRWLEELTMELYQGKLNTSIIAEDIKPCGKRIQ